MSSQIGKMKVSSGLELCWGTYRNALEAGIDSGNLILYFSLCIKILNEVELWNVVCGRKLAGDSKL